MDTIKCPHCGGQTRNFSVCDYCGSIITPISNEKDQSNETPNQEIDKLRNAIQQNLNEQLRCQGENHVTTIISAGKTSISLINPLAISDYLQVDDETTLYPHNPLNTVSNISLVLRIILWDSELESRSLVPEHEDIINSRVEAKEKYEWFIHSGVASLFTKTIVAEHSVFKFTDCSSKYHAYYLDCGKDSVETARIIAQYLFGTTAISEKDNIEYDQSSVLADLYKSRLKRQYRTERITQLKFSLLYLGLFLFGLLITYINFDKIKIGDISYANGLSILAGLFGAFMLLRTIINSIKARNKAIEPNRLSAEKTKTIKGQPQPGVSTTVTSSEKEPKKNKILLFSLLSIICLIAIVGGCFIFFTDNDKNHSDDYAAPAEEGTVVEKVIEEASCDTAAFVDDDCINSMLVNQVLIDTTYTLPDSDYGTLVKGDIFDGHPFWSFADDAMHFIQVDADEGLALGDGLASYNYDKESGVLLMYDGGHNLVGKFWIYEKSGKNHLVGLYHNDYIDNEFIDYEEFYEYYEEDEEEGD